MVTVDRLAAGVGLSVTDSARTGAERLVRSLPIATRQLDPALVIGGSVAESAQIEVSVSRPQMIRARSISDAGARVLYSDGQNVSLLDETMKVYATAPLAGTIDEIVE